MKRKLMGIIMLTAVYAMLSMSCAPGHIQPPPAPPAPPAPGR